LSNRCRRTTPAERFPEVEAFPLSRFGCVSSHCYARYVRGAAGRRYHAAAHLREEYHACWSGGPGLRTAPSIGALCMLLAIAHMPPFKRAGRTLLVAVTGFSVACPGYLDYPFQIKRFGHGSLALPHLLNTFRSSQPPLFSERMIQVARTGQCSKLSAHDQLFTKSCLSQNYAGVDTEKRSLAFSQFF
jgi:hypothetical protein